ncbi:MAG: hypothetical protein AB1646_23895 [Thermodesulfobacteriota bacterium]
MPTRYHIGSPESRRICRLFQFALSVIVAAFLVEPGWADDLEGKAPKTAVGKAPELVIPPFSNGIEPSPWQPRSLKEQLAWDAMHFPEARYSELFPGAPDLDLRPLGRHTSAGMSRSVVFADAVIPVAKDSGSTFFAEFHGENRGLFSRSPTGAPGGLLTTHLSLGGGYRSFAGDRVLLGVNGFYDTGVFGKFSPSWSWGIEMAAAVGAHGLFDVTVNHYGNRLGNPRDLFRRWQRGAVDVEAETGYTHRIADGLADLRVRGGAYQFNTRSTAWDFGYKTGADLTLGKGALRLAYEHGWDRAKGSYNFVGAQVGLKFGLWGLFEGRNPFSFAWSTPVSRSRYLESLLTRNVKRKYPLDLLPGNAGGFRIF